MNGWIHFDIHLHRRGRRDREKKKRWEGEERGCFLTSPPTALREVEKKGERREREEQ